MKIERSQTQAHSMIWVEAELLLHCIYSDESLDLISQLRSIFFVHKDIVMYAWSWFSIIFLRFYFGFFVLWTLYLKGEGNCACLEVYFLARYTLLLLSFLSRKSFFSFTSVAWHFLFVWCFCVQLKRWNLLLFDNSSNLQCGKLNRP